MGRKSKRSRLEQKTIPSVPPTTPPMMTQQQVPQPTLPPEIVQKLQQAMAEMIVLGGELGMEIATSDCAKLRECPIVIKSREIVNKVKEIREILKEVQK